MNDLERFANSHEMLGEARRYINHVEFLGVIAAVKTVLEDCDHADAEQFQSVLTRAALMRQVDPDATRGAIDYVRGWISWIIGRLEREAMPNE